MLSPVSGLLKAKFPSVFDGSDICKTEPFLEYSANLTPEVGGLT
jgi:hypothetical protein